MPLGGPGLSMFFILRIWTLTELRSGWRFLLGVTIVMTLASGVLALAPIFGDASADRALERLLDQQPAAIFTNPIERVRQPTTAAATALVDADIAAATDRHLARLAGPPTRITTSLQGGIDSQPQPLVAQFQLFPELDRNVVLTDGRFATDARTEEGRIAVMVGRDAADNAGIHVGDQWTFTFIGGETEVTDLEVVGIIKPKDPLPVAFQGSTGRFELIPVGDGTGPPAVGLFVTSAGMDAVGEDLSQNRLNHFVRQPLDPSGLNSDDVGPMRANLEAFGLELRSTPGVTVSLPIDRVLLRFQREERFSETPVLMIALQMAGVAMFAVVLLGVQYSRRSERERRLLRARGARRRQEVQIHASVGALVALPAAALGAPLAAFALSQAGRTGALSAITEGATLDTRISMTAWGLSVAGAAIGWLAFTMPVWLQSGREASAQRRIFSRVRSGSSLFHRYFLDVGLLVVGGIMFRQFDVESGQTRFSALGGDSIDPVLLISPGLLLIAFALLVARLLPPIVGRIGSWSARANTPTWVTLGLFNVARDPGRPMSVLALGLFVAAVGTIAATYSETFDHTIAERVRYEAGADLRAVAVSPALPASATAALRPLDESPDVRAAGAAARQLGQLGIEQSGSRAVLLAVQTDRFGELVDFRDDFAVESLDSILESIRLDPEPAGLALPAGTEGLALWVRTDPPAPGFLVTARIVDDGGRTRSVTFAQPQGPDWQRMDVAFTSDGSAHVIALTLSALGSAVRAPAGKIWFDDLTATTSDGEVILDSFDAEGGWFSGEGDLAGGDDLSSEAAAARDSTPALLYEWRRLQGDDERFLVRDSANLPVPVAMSAEAMEASGIVVGDVIPFALPSFSLPLRVAAEIKLFPTLDPANGGLILADLRAVQSGGTTLSSANVVPITEIWVQAESDRVVAGLERSIDQIYLPTQIIAAGDLLETLESDPFSAAGAGGLFLVGFVGLLVVAMIAIVLIFAAAAQERTQEISVLRTVGYSQLSATLQAASESAVLLVVGAVIGVWAGRQISGSLLSFLDTTSTGAEAVPPLLLGTDWGVAVVGMVGLIGVGAIAIALLARIAAARSVAEVVRFNEI